MPSDFNGIQGAEQASTCYCGPVTNNASIAMIKQTGVKAFKGIVLRATGYGARRPRDCWISAWLVAIEVIWGQLLDAITLGIIFARIAHPKNRARTVFISDSAVIARRDGTLKFMFRIADVRQTQVWGSTACVIRLLCFTSAACARLSTCCRSSSLHLVFRV